MQKTTINSLVNDLHKLGVKKGDTLFIKANMINVGFIKEAPKTGLLDALLEAVGPEGTLVISTFTRTHIKYLLKEDHIFTKDSKPYTGLLSELMLDHPDCVRSTHPVNSFAAIGKHANHICDQHTPESPSYQPIQTLADIGSKCIIIGCVDTSPAPTTTHWAQYLLGQSKQNLRAGKVGIYYFDESNTKKKFIRHEIGGHNAGAYKLYAHYVQRKFLFSGYVGNAYSVIMDTKKCLETDLEAMKQDPTYILCSDPDCFSCRGTWFYNMKDWPLFYLRALLRKLKLIRK